MRYFIFSALSFSILNLFSISCLNATHTHDTHVGLDQEIPLYENLGRVHHPVSTNQTAAQNYFDQGLTFLYAFNHDAAYASFRKAAQIDPHLAMAYWGMATAVGTNINSPVTIERQQKGDENKQQALRLREYTNDSEKAYIDAMAKRYTDFSNPNFNQLNIDYKNAMKELVNRYPDDLDAATFYAESVLNIHPWDQWTLDGQPKEGTLEAVNMLESVLKRDSMHLGANHLYIHAVEASKQPERALMSADRLTQMTPIAGHIQHMPSHIYMLVGEYEKAAIANQKAVKDDLNYIHQFGSKGYPTHYLSHNLSMLSRAYDRSGQLKNSLKAANDLYQFYWNNYPESKQQEMYAPTPLFVLMHFHQWQKILQLPVPPSELKLTTALWHLARADALAATGQIQQAQQEQQLFRAEWKNIPKDLSFGNNTTDDILAIADDYLSARLASQQNRLPEAIDFLRKGVAAEDVLKYDEPTNWPFSLRESLGGALLKAKAYAEAEAVFRQDLENHPGSGRSLYGLLLALQAQQRHTDAYWIKQRLDRAWHSSDTCLTIDALW